MLTTRLSLRREESNNRIVGSLTMLQTVEPNKGLLMVKGQVGEMLLLTLGVTNMEELVIGSVNAQVKPRGVSVVARLVMR